jgi:transcriptional regulator with XRE-family HTH domain
LAQAVGVTRSAVAQWETDRAGQVGANLAAVATALGVTAEYLFSGQTGSDASNATESADEMALRRLFRACTAEDKAFLLRTAVRLARQAEREQRAAAEQPE